MADTDFQPIHPARLDWQENTPLASNFGDSYFSANGGAEESDYVFIRGNQLDERFSRLGGDTLFTIGETGFGTGLNFLLAAERFLATAPADSRLDYLSVEKHPLTVKDLATACSRNPVAPALARELLDHYPPATPGFHRLSLAGGRVRLTLALGDALAMLGQAGARVDAWFLDGFAPARNPDMWQQPLFRRLAELSRPGATLATFTAAGFVRRGLQEAGFEMTKHAGFGTKRHMLGGRVSGCWQAKRPDARGVAVIGAGLAGATLARALADRGCPVTLFDPTGIAGGASGNLAGVVYTTPSAHPTPQNRFYQSSFLQALHWFRRRGFPGRPDDGALDGVMQLPPHERGARKARQALAGGYWPASVMERAGGTDDAPWLFFPGGGYISPPAWCRHLLDHPGIELRTLEVMGIEPRENHWILDTGVAREAFPRVVLANAQAARAFHDLHWLPLKSIRGQVSYCAATSASRQWRHAWCHQGYLTPAIQDMHCVGATFDLRGTDPGTTPEEDRQNLQTLRDNLPDHWQALGGGNARVVDRRTGFRCQSRDFLPLAGPVPDAPAGLYLNLAHGSRGITGTPLCAELLATLICGETLPVDRDLLDALLPHRFIELKSGKTTGD